MVKRTTVNFRDCSKPEVNDLNVLACSKRRATVTFKSRPELMFLKARWHLALGVCTHLCLYIVICKQPTLESALQCGLSSVFSSTAWYLWPNKILLIFQNCSSHVRRAVVTCFSAGCCGRHGNRPVRYCKRCHSNHHSSEVGAAAETHLYQTSPPPINTRECGAEELVCTVEAVIR